MKDMNVQNILEALEDSIGNVDADTEQILSDYAIQVLGQLGIHYVEIGEGSDDRAWDIVVKVFSSALPIDSFHVVAANDKYKMWGKGIYVFAKYL